MRWTKLKQKIEERIVEPIQSRIRIDLTRYRWTRNEDGEIRVCLDGNRIYSASYWEFVKEKAAGKSESQLRNQGIQSDHFLAQELFQSLNLPIEKMLIHETPLIRGLAVIDKRCGRRRLCSINVSEEHEFVRLLHSLRCSE